MAVVSLASGCGESSGKSSPETPGDEGAFPVSVEEARQQIAIAQRPTRIVSLSPPATETLFAVGAGDEVIARHHRAGVEVVEFGGTPVVLSVRREALVSLWPSTGLAQQVLSRRRSASLCVHPGSSTASLRSASQSQENKREVLL